MNIGDRVKIKTGKRGNPPRGVIESVTAETIGGGPCAFMVRTRGKSEVYRADQLTVVPEFEESARHAE
jgi:hypothetical protein